MEKMHKAGSVGLKAGKTRGDMNLGIMRSIKKKQGLFKVKMTEGKEPLEALMKYRKDEKT